MVELVRYIYCATERSSSLQFPNAGRRIVAGLHSAAFQDPSARLHCDPHTSLAVSDFRNTVLGRLHCHPAFHASCGRETLAVSSQIQCIERYSQMLMTYSERLLGHSHLGYTKDLSGASLSSDLSMHRMSRSTAPGGCAHGTKHRSFVRHLIKARGQLCVACGGHGRHVLTHLRSLHSCRL